ncbi:MAG: response regulator [Aggregatilineales bacterium]
MRILYVEDDPSNVRAIERVAQRLKCELLVAGTADEGAHLATGALDLILLDLNLPDRDGLTLARELRAAGIGVPIIAVSAGALTSDKQLCLEAGCTDLVSKPFTFNQMCNYVSQYQRG